MRLLSVDWDYFFPTYPLDRKQCFLYDWTMKDALFYRGPGIWIQRGAAFLMNGRPLPDTSGAEHRFWDRFRLKHGAKLYYGDSHLYAAVIPERLDVKNVWNFDAHHDMGYHGARESFVQDARVECDNWMCAYQHWGAKTTVIYPAWRPDARNEESKPVFHGPRRIDKGFLVAAPFDVVYVCRSSAWTPPWLDAKFTRFLTACPLFGKGAVNMQEDYDALIPRQFTVDMINKTVEDWKSLLRTTTAGTEAVPKETP